MRSLLLTGKVVFALGIAGLGFLGFFNKDFIIGRPPAWPAGFNPGLSFSLFANTVIVVAGSAIIVAKRAKDSLAIVILILALSVSRHLLAFMQDWLNTYKSFALASGGLLVVVSFNKYPERKSLLISSTSVLLAIFFIASGYAHFKFADFVTSFIPAYIPFHGFFTYFTAVCLIAGGVGILLPPTRQLAALLSGVMLTGWFLLLHIPRFLADTHNLSDQMGLLESFTLAGVFFMLATLSTDKSVQ